MIAPVLAIGLAGHTMAQQPSNMHCCLGMFKYADNAVKAMMENPQDRSAAARKLIEGLGGKLDGAYFYATSGDWDGIVQIELPDSVTAEALYMTVQATGNFQKQAVACDRRAIQSGDGEGATSEDRLHAADHDEIVLGDL